ncbi:MAG: helix-turn-helix domain-containing protein [Luteolibacter sp.]
MAEVSLIDEMSALHQTHREFEIRLLGRLAGSERFLNYQDAFRTATGLPLRLVPSDPEHGCLDDQNINRSPFCEVLNLCKSACGACLDTNRLLMLEAEVHGPSTCHCFAGLCATAIPVKLGASVIGYLKTGQVFSRTPTEEQFEAILGVIGRRTLGKDMRAKLKAAFLQTRTVEPRRYQSMVTLLESFAEQLNGHAESLAIIEDGSEPTAITKARRHIHENLDQPLPLGQVARHAGLSESHFCRLFKDSAGLTFTDYINRCRIDWAKRELLKPKARISEIAFLVGYQSLSQFNRSFSRIVGSSPTLYRRERIERAAS